MIHEPTGYYYIRGTNKDSNGYERTLVYYNQHQIEGFPTDRKSAFYIMDEDTARYVEVEPDVVLEFAKMLVEVLSDGE